MSAGETFIARIASGDECNPAVLDLPRAEETQLEKEIEVWRRTTAEIEAGEKARTDALLWAERGFWGEARQVQEKRI